MSKHDKIAKLKEYVKNFVIKELEKDEELEEVSTTATAGIDGTGTGHYDTPRAFSAPTSGSQGGHPKPDVVGYKKVNESKELDTIEKIVKSTKNFMGVGKALKKVGIKSDFQTSMGLPRYTFKLNGKTYGILNKKSVSKPDRVVGDIAFGVMESINEGYGEMMDELEKIYRPSGAPPIVKQALKDLADEYDIGRVLYAARTNEKSFREVLDMKIDQLQSQYVNKKHINTIKRGKKLKEVTKQEVNALRNLVKGIGNLKKDFSKATKVGDKELRKRDYNKHYETLLDAEKAMVQLMQFFKTKEMLGEGRYHEYRNDESLTPKQKIGRSMREIRDALNELDRTVKMNLKLKTELKIKSEDYWKNTHKALTKISERLVKMANKVGNLK